MSQIITIDGGKKEPRICAGGPHKGENIWSVIDTGGVWYSLYCFDRPQKGQQYNVNITSKQVGDKTYRDAYIVGPAPAQFAQADAVHQLAQGIYPTPTPGQLATRAEYPAQGIGNGANAQPAPQSAPTGNVGPLNVEFKPSGRIAWADWALVTKAAWELSQELIPPMPFAEAVAYINTTLIAYSNNKIDLPVPLVAELEPGSDDFDWAEGEAK